MILIDIILLLAIASVATYFLSPYDPETIDLLNRNSSPSLAHPMGTDDLGRDVMTRLVVAGGVSVFASTQAVIAAGLLGLPTGLLAGYVGGGVDAVLSRIVDALMSLPSLLIALTVIGVLGPGLNNAMIAVGIAYGPQLYRVVRSVTITVKSAEFVEAAEVAGAPARSIVTKHVLRNVAGHVLVNIAVIAGFAILLESALSFLGLGVQPPTPSWGIMLNRAYAEMQEQPLTMFFPGAAIMVAVLLLNLLADAIRDTVVAPVRVDE